MASHANRGVVGIVTGLTMLVPPNTGAVGLMMSLIPTAARVILLARAFSRAARSQAF